MNILRRTAFERLLDAFRCNGLAVIEHSATRASAQAPGHSSADRSVSILDVGGKVVMHCHAGENTADVLAAIGLTMADMFDNRRDLTYRYPDAAWAKRKAPQQRNSKKSFEQSASPRGGLLYRQDRITDAVTVHLVEGEQDADALATIGVPAVSARSGASSAHLANYAALAGKHVIVWQDKDNAGRARVARIEPILKGIAESVTVVEAPDGCHDAADAVARDGHIDHVTTVNPSSDEPDADADFWQSRDVLRHIRSFARARYVSPDAVLAAALCRVIAAVEPTVVLPPTVGSKASLNFFAALVGRSGQGKDAAAAVAADCLEIRDYRGKMVEILTRQPGSGEGLAATFKARHASSASADDEPEGEVIRTTRAHLVVPEVGTLEAIAGRQGSTLVGELLKAYMGQSIGFDNAKASTTTSVEAHSYRLCLTVGVQPENAGFFLSRGKDGLPQRLFWASTIDPTAPEDCTDAPAPMTVRLPKFAPADAFYVLRIPDDAAAEIRACRHRIRIGDADVDPLDGHANLTRLKIAVGMMLLEGRTVVSDEDWRLAGVLLDRSSRVREHLQSVLADKRRKANRARGHEAAEREEIVAERRDQADRRRVADAIMRKLNRSDGWVSRTELRQTLKGDLRSLFDSVADALVDDGAIEKRDAGKSFECRLSRDWSRFGPDLKKAS
ncbi:hypothetical protein FOS14_09015 [Skermania sp. ID1734]|nr:toprim domain-containing protein [Skermania sp. ID1734]TSD99963.1 hypothetical protein FOS14_09015 [Skermania sp. ID1734]